MTEPFVLQDVSNDPSFNTDHTALRLVDRRAIYHGSSYHGMVGIDRDGKYHFFGKSDFDVVFTSRDALIAMLLRDFGIQVR